MKRGVLIGDMHTGSLVALADPSRCKSRDQFSPLRRHFFNRWRKYAHGPWHAPDFMAIVGDAIDGRSRRDGGVGEWTTDIWAQVAHAAHLIRMWEPKKVYVVLGSDYHVKLDDTGLYAEEHLARELGAEFAPGQSHLPPDERMRSDFDMPLEADGVLFHLCHAVGYTKNMAYRGTSLGVEMLQAALHMPEADVLVRAHTHYFWHAESGSTHGFILPCWQGKTPFMRKKNPLAVNPHIGFVGVECDGGAFSYTKYLTEIQGAKVRPRAKV